MATGLPSVLMLMRRAAAFDEAHFPLNARVECRAFVSERILVGLRWHAEKAAVVLDVERDNYKKTCTYYVKPTSNK